VAKEKRSEGNTSYSVMFEESARIVHENCDNGDKWVLDSGVSSHMTKHRDCIFNYMQLNVPKRVFIPNQDSILALGKGDIRLRMFIEGRNKIITWHDVLHVPTLGENLFSLPTARNGGLAVGEQGNHIVLRDKRGDVVVQAT